MFKKQISERPTDFGRLLKRTAGADPETKMMVLKGSCVENPVVLYRSFNLMTSTSANRDLRSRDAKCESWDLAHFSLTPPLRRYGFWV